jgi:hypothetical protein
LDQFGDTFGTKGLFTTQEFEGFGEFPSVP